MYWYVENWAFCILQVFCNGDIKWIKFYFFHPEMKLNGWWQQYHQHIQYVQRSPLFTNTLINANCVKSNATVDHLKSHWLSWTIFSLSQNCERSTSLHDLVGSLHLLLPYWSFPLCLWSIERDLNARPSFFCESSAAVLLGHESLLSSFSMSFDKRPIAKTQIPVWMILLWVLLWTKRTDTACALEKISERDQIKSIDW